MSRCKRIDDVDGNQRGIYAGQWSVGAASILAGGSGGIYSPVSGRNQMKKKKNYKTQNFQSQEHDWRFMHHDSIS